MKCCGPLSIGINAINPFAALYPAFLSFPWQWLWGMAESSVVAAAIYSCVPVPEVPSQN